MFSFYKYINVYQSNNQTQILFLCQRKNKRKNKLSMYWDINERKAKKIAYIRVFDKIHGVASSYKMRWSETREAKDRERLQLVVMRTIGRQAVCRNALCPTTEFDVNVQSQRCCQQRLRLLSYSSFYICFCFCLYFCPCSYLYAYS